MFRHALGGLMAVTCLISSAAAQDTTYTADFGNKQYMSLNGVRRGDVYRNEPMAVRVDARIRQTDAGPKKPGKFKVGISNFNPRGGSADGETTADAQDPTTLVAFIPVGSGTSNQYDGEVFKSAEGIDPAGAHIDGLSPRWMIGGLNEDLREGDRTYRGDKTKGTPPKDVPEAELGARMFDGPTDPEEAKKAEENKRLIDAALAALLAKGDDMAKKIGAARAGADDDVAGFFAHPPEGLDLSAFAEITDAARRRRILDLIGIQVVGRGPTDAATMTILANVVKQGGTPKPAATATAVTTEPASPTPGATGTLQRVPGRAP